MLGVAVRTDGALLTAGAADGFALQLHRQGNVLGVVFKEKEKKKNPTQIPQRFDLEKHTGVTTVAATWRLEGDLALLALGVVPDKRVFEQVRGEGPSVGVGFEAAQDEQLGVHRQRLGHLRVDLEHADLPRETGMRREETQVALHSGGSVTRVESYLKHGCLRFSQLVERWFASGHFYDGAS